MTRKQSAPLLVFALLLAVYALTLASGVALWDSGEFLAAIKTLGIPHPAGTPFYVLVARLWSLLLAPVFGFARSVNLFSAAATAAACAIVAYLIARWSGKIVAGICAGILGGAMTTVWSSATETEVYALALLLGCVILFAADRCGRQGDLKWGMLAAYLCGLALSLHLSTFVVVPAALVLAFTDRDGTVGIPSGRRRPDGRRSHHRPISVGLAAFALFLLGASCVAFLLIRARHDPAINQGNPSTIASLWDVLTRRQYGARTLWPRSAPLYLQIGNLFQYADWQFALGLSQSPGPSFARTPITIVFAMLGIAGCIDHRRIDRRSWRAWLTLLVVASLGVIVYLNLKAGPSYGHGIVPAGNHEARERDYFFFFVFVSWAGWAAIGLARAARRLPAALASLPIVVAALPLALNWTTMDRSHATGDSAARELALTIVQDLPPNAVLLSIGDNDTYPVWYIQQVEGIRPDVTVVTLPLLSASWYRAELARRTHLLGSSAPAQWLGEQATVESIRSHAAASHRPVINSLLSSH
ncbi:MAG: DUF2723 domain-containing protein [Gemmatimonadota bacterium]|nr:DUF2723 domain-containing protein [Gemmatimonadota bacterium]